MKNVVNNSILAQGDCIVKGPQIDPFIADLQGLNEMISSLIQKIIRGTDENLNLANDVKEYFESFKKILKKDSFYEDEYYTFYSIKIMADYLLDDESLHHYLDMVIDLISELIMLIQSKKGNSKDYPAKKEEYNLFFMKYEQRFYTTIYEPSEHYDEETLSKIMTGLLDLEKDRG